MRLTRPLFATVALLPLCCLSSTAARPSDGEGQADPESPVKSFGLSCVPMVTALLEFARQQHVLIGIEYVDLAAVNEPIRVPVEHTTVARTLDEILKSQPGYYWHVREGVVVVSNRSAPAGRQNLFDFVLRDFSIPKCTLPEANNALMMSLDVGLHPDIKGFVGDYSPGNTFSLVGPLSLKAATVRQALDSLVSQAGYAVWVAQVPPQHLGKLPPAGLWRLIDFRDPASTGLVDTIGQSIRRYEAQSHDR